MRGVITAPRRSPASMGTQKSTVHGSGPPFEGLEASFQFTSAVLSALALLPLRGTVPFSLLRYTPSQDR